VAASPFRSLQFMIPFCISWFVWISVHQLALYSLGIDWFTAMIDSIVSNTLLIFIAMLIFTVFRFYLPRNRGFVNLLVWMIVFTVGWFFINNWLLSLLLKTNTTYLSFLYNGWPVRAATGFLINGCTVLIGYTYFNWQEKKEAELQRTNAEKLTKEAELYNLRQQLQPHFLFNSLNSINALIGSQPAQARTMVQQLSEFLRSTLKKEEQQWVKLEDEIHSLQLYLDIEKVRFGSRLSATIEIDSNALQARIPVLLLQPLVENAIKFGLYDTTEAIEIQLHAGISNQHLKLEVQNPFDAQTATANKGTGFGLTSVSRRLFLLFGRNDLLQTETKENIFVTKVLVPQLLFQTKEP
jgi:two-component system, LytTR family, sensor kinase